MSRRFGDMTMVRGTEEIRQLWAGVFIRDRRVKMAVDDWNVGEAGFRRNHHFGAGPGLGASQYELIEYMRRHSNAFERLTYHGEAVLMFADAATNALAEAVFGSWGVPVKQPTLLAIAEGVESGKYATQDPDLSPEVERLWAVYLGVNFPRHVIAVHPPDGRSANSFQMGTLAYMGWAAPWDPENREWRVLSERLKDETSIPDNMASTPDRLLAWVIDQPHGLSRESRERLQRYAKRNGVFVSPVRVAAKVQALIRDVARKFGYQREDFFSD
jgi:hypothetical protein